MRSPCNQTRDPYPLGAASAFSHAAVTAAVSMPWEASRGMFARIGLSYLASGTLRLLTGGSEGGLIRCIAVTNPASSSAMTVCSTRAASNIGVPFSQR